MTLDNLIMLMLMREMFIHYMYIIIIIGYENIKSQHRSQPLACKGNKLWAVGLFSREYGNRIIFEPHPVTLWRGKTH